MDMSYYSWSDEYLPLKRNPTDSPFPAEICYGQLPGCVCAYVCVYVSVIN